MDEGVGGRNCGLPLQCWKQRGLVPTVCTHLKSFISLVNNVVPAYVNFFFTSSTFRYSLAVAWIMTSWAYIRGVLRPEGSARPASSSLMCGCPVAPCPCAPWLRGLLAVQESRGNGCWLFLGHPAGLHRGKSVGTWASLALAASLPPTPLSPGSSGGFTGPKTPWPG